MTVILKVSHSTIYRYANPVSFSEHRVMCRPLISHDLRMIDSTLRVSPYADVHWVQDVFSNSVAVVRPREPANELRIDSGFTIEHYGVPGIDLPLEDRARTFPFDYNASERLDLSTFLQPQTLDPDRLVLAFAQRFASPGLRTDTRAMLQAMTACIRAEFNYIPRDAQGTQTPTETLAMRSGSCRDFALLMIEAVRRLGLAARFVSGYLYDGSLDGNSGPGLLGSGATHAWLNVFLPGAGWISFDPTNTLFGGVDLIRVAVTRDPAQAAPISGAFFGGTGDYLGMSVDVKVQRVVENMAVTHV